MSVRVATPPSVLDDMRACEREFAAARWCHLYDCSHVTVCGLRLPSSDSHPAFPFEGATVCPGCGRPVCPDCLGAERPA